MKNTIRIEWAILHMSQTELAERAGVSRQTIHAVETNKHIPSAVLALKIARVFQIRAEDLFVLEETD